MKRVVLAAALVLSLFVSAAITPSEALACDAYVNGYYRADGTYVRGTTGPARTARPTTTTAPAGTTTRTPVSRGHVLLTRRPAARPTGTASSLRRENLNQRTHSRRGANRLAPRFLMSGQAALAYRNAASQPEHSFELNGRECSVSAALT